MRRAFAGEEKKIDYKNYRFTAPEFVLNLLIGLILAWAIGHFFYDSLIVSAMASAFIPMFLSYRRKEYGRRRRDELVLQFRGVLDFIEIITAFCFPEDIRGAVIVVIDERRLTDHRCPQA